MTKLTTATKKAASILLAMLVLFAGMSVSASAGEAPTFTPIKVTEDMVTLNVKELTISVAKATVKINGNDVAVIFTADPTAAAVVGQDGATLFYNLKPGTSYTIMPTITYDGETYSAGSSYSVKLKNSQNAPATPTPDKVTSSSISVKIVSGAQYAIALEGSTAELAWDDKPEFNGLQANTTYVVYARYKETQTAYASPNASVAITTFEASAGDAPATPVLQNKTNTTITVVPVEGVEYTIDSGKTWQVSNTFKNLKPDTLYSIGARKTFDPDTQEETPVSVYLNVLTNKRESYDAAIERCVKTVTSKGEVTQNKEFTFVITGDGLIDKNSLQYGDTRLLPICYYYTEKVNDTTAVSATTYFGTDNTGKITPVSKGTMSIFVTFQRQKYTGSSWENLGAAEVHEFKQEVKGPFNGILNFFIRIFNVLLNDIPARISAFLNSGVIGKLIKAIAGLA